MIRNADKKYEVIKFLTPLLSRIIISSQVYLLFLIFTLRIGPFHADFFLTKKYISTTKILLNIELIIAVWLV